jgi:hypothetical protein
MKKDKKPFEEIDSLSLLAHKVAANVFDLSSSQVNVSIRDQMVRAQQLVVDLKAAHPEARSILVVGMGAAGMTAALTACEVGFDEVHAVESKAQPFALFRGVTSRYVGPFMYEWPSPFSTNQSYPSHGSTPWNGHGSSPLAWPASMPISAHELAKLLRRGVKDWSKKRKADHPTKPLPFLWVGVDKKAVQTFATEFAQVAASRAEQEKERAPLLAKAVFRDLGAKAALWNGLPMVAKPGRIKPDYLILAAGMGEENVSIPGNPARVSPRFWANDKLKDAAVANQNVVVLGGGDGAIQDTLRALTIHDHPLTLILQLEKVAPVRRALEKELPTLLSADRQLRQHSSWSRHPAGFAMVDHACAAAAKTLAKIPAVRKQVRLALRKGTGAVTHIVRDSHFDKAYLLNRFVIYLISECVSSADKVKGYMDFKLVFDLDVKNSQRIKPNKGKGKGEAKWALEVGKKAEIAGTHTMINIDNVVVRFGILSDSIPGPTLIQLSDEYPRHRTTLNRVELPFVALRG